MSDIFILAPDPSGAVCDCTQLATVCASCTPNPCSCALFIPDPLSPTFVYDTLAHAQAGIVDTVLSCIMFNVEPPLNTYTTKTITVTSSIAISLITPPNVSRGIVMQYVSINVKASSILSIAYSFTPAPGPGIISAVRFILRTCEGVPAGTYTSPNSSGTNSGTGTINVTTGGEYILSLEAAIGSTGPFDPTYTNASDAEYTISSSDTITINPVIALYTNPSDPLVPYQLEACPAFYIPPFAPTLGVYADLATAQAELDYGVSCIAYASPVGFPPNVYSGMSAIPSAHSLSLTGTVTMPDTSDDLTLFIWAGFTLTANTLLTITWTTAALGDFLRSNDVQIFTADGASNVFAFNSGVVTASTTVTLPVGKYVFFVSTVGTANTMTTTWTIGGTGFLNQTLVALYANGANCPTHLDCTP